MMGQETPKATASRLSGQALVCWVALIQEGFSGQVGKAKGGGYACASVQGKNRRTVAAGLQKVLQCKCRIAAK